MIEIDEISKKLMLDFLQNHFPIKRLRDKTHRRKFRRGIVMDGDFTDGTTVNRFMAPKEERNRTYQMLYKILDEVFGFTKTEINVVLLDYFNILK